MPFKLPLRLEQIAQEDVIEVFRLFCNAFEIKFDDSNKKSLEAIGMDDLRKGEQLEYRFSTIGKFFITPRPRQGFIKFHAYAYLNDPHYRLKDEKFEELVKKYFDFKKENKNIVTW